MYSLITNPLNGNKTKSNSILGKKIIISYLKGLIGGASASISKDINDMKVKELKVELKKLGIKTTGLKNDLKERLSDFYRKKKKI